MSVFLFSREELAERLKNRDSTAREKWADFFAELNSPTAIRLCLGEEEEPALYSAIGRWVGGFLREVGAWLAGR